MMVKNNNKALNLLKKITLLFNAFSEFNVRDEEKFPRVFAISFA